MPLDGWDTSFPIALQRQHPNYQKIVKRTVEFLKIHAAWYPPTSHRETLVIANNWPYTQDGEPIIDGILSWAGCSLGSDLDVAWARHVFNASGFIVVEPGNPTSRDPLILLAENTSNMTIWVAAESLGQRGTAGEVIFANPVSNHKLKAWEEEMRARVGADDENYVKYQDQEVQREKEEETRKEAKTQDEGHAKR